MVEADRESNVTSTASCFCVPLSRNECARTIAPKPRRKHQTKLLGRSQYTWKVIVAKEQLECCQYSNFEEAQLGLVPCNMHLGRKLPLSEPERASSL